MLVFAARFGYRASLLRSRSDARGLELVGRFVHRMLALVGRRIGSIGGVRGRRGRGTERVGRVGRVAMVGMALRVETVEMVGNEDNGALLV
jgi:hypothetical protein